MFFFNSSCNTEHFCSAPCNDTLLERALCIQNYGVCDWRCICIFEVEMVHLNAMRAALAMQNLKFFGFAVPKRVGAERYRCPFAIHPRFAAVDRAACGGPHLMGWMALESRGAIRTDVWGERSKREFHRGIQCVKEESLKKDPECKLPDDRDQNPEKKVSRDAFFFTAYRIKWLVATSCAAAILWYVLRGTESSMLDGEGPPRDQVIFEESSLTQEMSYVGLFVQAIETCIRVVYLANIFLPLYLTLPLVMLFPALRKYWWKALRRIWMLAGGCWIKYGQWASTRPDIFSKEVLSELVLLQDQCLTHSFEKTRKIIREECGAELEEIFSDFDPVPMASGTIAQVYRATLRLTGQRVAVKVVHPGVEKVVLADLWIMSFVMRVVSLLPNMKWMSLEEAMETFKASMLVQLDMRNEARSLSRFQKNFRGDSTVVFPRVIGHMCRRHVLIETCETGIPMNVYLASDPPISERKRLAQIGLRAYLTMLLLHNFIHGDLHPGNILVRKLSDDQLQLVLLDFGLICQLSETDWCHFKQLFKCIVQGDGEGGARLMIEHARQVKCSPEDQRKFVEEVNVLFRSIRNNKLSNIQVGLFLSDILNVVRKYQIKIESNFSTLCVATVVLEGIGRQLDPDINILTQSVPILLWSEKAGLDDRMVFMRERLKDDFAGEPGQRVSLLRGVASVARYMVQTVFSSVGYDIQLKV